MAETTSWYIGIFPVIALLGAFYYYCWERHSRDHFWWLPFLRRRVTTVILIPYYWLIRGIEPIKDLRHKQIDSAALVAANLHPYNPPEDFTVVGKACQYQPLPSKHHIRILTLHPGSATDPLVCSLEDLDLSYADLGRRFEALSYRWTGKDRYVICSGGRLPIPQSLFDLLAHLRQQQTPRYVWADAVCINQQDTEEKSFQLPLMGEIYTKCDKCIIWFGRQAPETALAFRLLRVIATTATPSSARLEPDSYAVLSSIMTTPRQWIALASMLSHEWFSRVWTYQEMMLPPKLEWKYGSFEISGIDFELALERIGKPGWRFVRHLQHTQGFYNCQLLHERRKNLNANIDNIPGLVKALQQVRGRDSTDPRDKILGVAGLCDQTFFESLGFDYSQTTEELYSRMVGHMLREPNLTVPELLLVVSRQAAAQGDRALALPTWVPDWSVRLHESKEMSDFEATYESWRAGGNLDTETDLDLSAGRNYRLTGEALHIRAKLLAPLSAFLERDSTSFYQDFQTRARSIRYIFHEYISSGPGHRQSQTQHFLVGCMELMTKGLLAGSTRTAEWGTKNSHMEEAHRMLFSLLNCGYGDSLEDLEFHKLLQVQTSQQARNHPALGQLESWLTARKFGIAKGPDPGSDYQALAGWVPLSAAPGDWVCIIEGSNLPFVLRFTGEEDTFSVLGHCFMVNRPKSARELCSRVRQGRGHCNCVDVERGCHIWIARECAQCVRLMRGELEAIEEVPSRWIRLV